MARPGGAAFWLARWLPAFAAANDEARHELLEQGRSRAFRQAPGRAAIPVVAGLATAFAVVAISANLLAGLPLWLSVPLSGAAGAAAAIALSNFLTARLIRSAVEAALREGRPGERTSEPS